MKLLLVFFICTILHAQDSTKVKSNLGNPPDIFDVRTSTSIDKNPLIKINPLRNWNLNSDDIFKNRIAFPLAAKQKKQNFIDSDLFYIVAGSAIIFGAAAAYTKNESNKYYDKYKLTNDSNYLNKTNRFDIYSGISIGAMQINFGYLIYKFLTD